MNRAKVNEYDYINFLIAAQKAYSCTEAERVQPESANAAAHDAITRLLHRMEPSAQQLWQEAQLQVRMNQGILGVDDSTLDKWYAEKMELVTRHCSGKHGRVVQGINLISLLWSEGDRHISLDYRFYEKSVEGATRTTTPARCWQLQKNEGLLLSVWCLIAGTAAWTISSWFEAMVGFG